MEPGAGATRSAAHRRDELFAAIALVVVAAAGLLAIGLAAIHATRPVPSGVRSPASTAALFVAIELTFAVSGAVLVRRRVAPAIGWLFLAVALIDGVNRVGEYWSAAAVVARPGVLPAGYGMAWLDGTTEHAVLVLLAAVVLLFPTGRPPSAAWRWPLWALACGTVVAGLARALQPGDLEGVPFFADNPIGWSAADDPLDVVQALGAAVLVAGVAGCLLSLAGRWLSGSEVARRQLEGLALVVLVVAVVVPVVPLLPDPFTVLYAVAMIAFPVVLTLAVLELHLDALDRVLRATVATFVAVALLAGVYVVIVVGVGAVLGRAADPWLVVAAVAAVAALLLPVRRAAQRVSERLIAGPRTKPRDVLADFAWEAGGASGDGLLDRLAEVVADGTGATAAEVWARHGEQLSCDGRWPRGTSTAGAATIEATVPLAIAAPAHACPVERDGQLLGALAIRIAPTARWRAQDDQLLGELAAAAALVLENEQLIADLRASRERLVEAQDAERRRLERDLHDGAQQRLLALVIDVRRRRAQLDALDHDEVAGVLDRTADELQTAVDELRDLARGIHPALLTASGLEAALRSVADRAPLPVTVDAPVGRMPAAVESTAYFVACEALANTVRHGGASHVVITASHDRDQLVLEVTDDGDGGASTAGGTGLTGLADRVAAVGGSFSVDSVPGAGTKVRAELPCASS